MLEFIRSVYGGFVMVGFWIFLIGCTINGGVIGASIGKTAAMWSGKNSGGGHPILGGFIGLVVGFVLDILIFGFISTIVNMDENLEYLRYNSSKTGNTSGGNSSGINLSNVSPINPTVINSADSWICKKCGERNPNTASSCKGCGAYK